MSINGDRNIDKRSRKSRFSDASTHTANWFEASADTIKSVILAATAKGCAIRFGVSRDGSAFGVGLYEHDEVYTVWFAPTEDIDAKLEKLIAYFEDYEQGQPTPQNGKKASK